MKKKYYLLNAFSFQMLNLDSMTSGKVAFEVVDSLPPLDTLISAIGHADTAAILGVPMNRVNVKLGKGDTAYVAQLVGGRLPEGATTLPNGSFPLVLSGFSFKFLKITIE